MIDPGTGMTALGIALGGKDLLIKILGPTAEYLGTGLKDFASQRVENVKDIFSNASTKLGAQLDEAGSVPPKVLKGILDDGSFANDSLSIEYFGGVLASSKTSGGRDDRGAYYNSLISRLSVYQLRSHYLFYHLYKGIFNGEKININTPDGRDRTKFFIPLRTYIDAMGFIENKELGMWQLANILTHVMNGLSNEGLISNDFSYGGKDALSPYFPNVDSMDREDQEGIIISPSTQGVELFLWAYGKGKAPVHEFLINNDEFKLDASFTGKITRPAKRVRPN